MTSVIFNAIAAKHGGALVVHKAMLSSIDFEKLKVKPCVITNSDLAESELKLDDKPEITVVRIPNVALPPLFLKILFTCPRITG